MNFFASILVTIIFLSFSIAVKKHFSSKTTPRGMILISALSIIGFSWIQWSIFYEKPNDTILFLVCLLTFLSGCLFFSAIRQTARSDLKLAFDNNIPLYILFDVVVKPIITEFRYNIFHNFCIVIFNIQ